MGYKEDIAKTFDEAMEAARNVSASGSLTSGGYIYPPQGAILYASLSRRALAYLIDKVLLSFVSVFLFKFIPLDFIGAIIDVFLPISENTYSNVSDLIYIGVILCIWITFSWLYFSVLESSRWQATLGKKLVKLKVADKLGNRIGFMKANIRIWVRMISVLFLFAGYLTISFTKKRQAFHDIVAGTVIVKVVV